jgi:hypothetical protein
MEIAGEDPRCILHGSGTMWAKENPDLCEFSERYRALEARVERLTETLIDWRNCWLCPETDFDAQAPRLLRETESALEQLTKVEGEE